MDRITENIKKLREEKGISKAKMSEILELDPSNYNRYERLGRDWTISQVQKIAAALSISIVELLTGESQPIKVLNNNTEFEAKMNDLLKRLKDKEELIDLKDKQFESIESQFQKYVYQQVAETAYEKGYSRIRFFERKTGKTIRNVTWQDNPEDIRNYTIKELIYTDVSWHINTILKEQPKGGLKKEWEISYDINIIPEHKQAAVNCYFSRMIGGGFPDEIVLIMESGVITDKMLSVAYKKAKLFEEEGFEEDEWVNEDLELIKIPVDDIVPVWKGDKVRFVKKAEKKTKGEE